MLKITQKSSHPAGIFSVLPDKMPDQIVAVIYCRKVLKRIVTPSVAYTFQLLLNLLTLNKNNENLLESFSSGDLFTLAKLQMALWKHWSFARVNIGRLQRQSLQWETKAL